MKISDILRHKHTTPGSSVVTIAPSDTVTTLLAALAEHNVGALVVVDPSSGGAVAGIVSERDIVRRIAETMTARRVRHMPVIDNGRLTGIVSIGDVVSSRIRQLEQDRGQLEQYISS